MSTDGNYPDGSQYDKNAPWNMKDSPERDFKVTCSQTLSKTVEVFTNAYTSIPEREFDGENTVTVIDYDTSNIDWKEEYKNNDYYTPLQLIELFQKYLLDEVNGSNMVSRNPKFLHHIITECNNWIEDELEIVED